MFLYIMREMNFLSSLFERAKTQRHSGGPEAKGQMKQNKEEERKRLKAEESVHPLFLHRSNMSVNRSVNQQICQSIIHELSQQICQSIMHLAAVGFVKEALLPPSKTRIT